MSMCKYLWVCKRCTFSLRIVFQKIMHFLDFGCANRINTTQTLAWFETTLFCLLFKQILKKNNFMGLRYGTLLNAAAAADHYH